MPVLVVYFCVCHVYDELYKHEPNDIHGHENAASLNDSHLVCQKIVSTSKASL